MTGIRKALDELALAEREKLGGTPFADVEVDEMTAIRKLAEDTFGKANVRHRNGTWGGLIEGGPEEPGMMYLGFFIDPPTVHQSIRRRQLVLRGNSHAALKRQAVELERRGGIEAFMAELKKAGGVS